MKFEEALKLMREGKKVTLPNWDEQYYIYIKGDSFFDVDDHQVDPPGSCILSNDWKIYEEKPQLCNQDILRQVNEIVKDHFKSIWIELI